jgi:hypothetical protein
MSEKQDYPSLLEQGKNLAKFSWDLISHIQKNQDKFLFVSDETYKERIMTCKGCDKYDEFESKCKQCGCFVPVKAKVILDSCPLGKWTADNNSWEEKFKDIVWEMEGNIPKDAMDVKVDKPQES